MSARTLPTSIEIAELRRRYPRAFAESPRRRLRRLSALAAFAAVTLAGFWWVDFVPARLIAGLDKLGWLLPHMFPPTHGGWLPDFAWGLVETLAIAFLGTLLAAMIAVPLSLLGARNLVSLWLMRFTLRRFADGLRGIDGLIWAIIFVSVVGLGPFAGVLAIAVPDIGMFTKLFAEAIENIERRQVDGVRAAGARPMQLVRFGVIPQVLPIFLSTVLYYFESNVRSATVLGIVGAGGIGIHLSERIRVNEWEQASFLILMILVTVTIIDQLSSLVRRRIIEPPRSV